MSRKARRNDDRRELTEEELERQDAEELPDRKAMSTVGLEEFWGGPIIRPMPIDPPIEDEPGPPPLK